jgi:hypothetical protein
MGYKRTQTYYNLEFDAEFEGLEVRLRRGSIRERMEFEKLDDWQERVTRLADFIESWNVEYDEDDEKAGRGTAGEVMPCDAESLWSLEEPTLVAILRGWTNAVTVPIPLETPSTDGATEEEQAPTVDLELEASMPMAASPAA